MMFVSGLLFFTVAIGVNNCEAASIGRVIGGSSAPDHKFPYQVSIRRRSDSQRSFHFCSGSILNEYWILTAGHCFACVSGENAVIVAGTNYLNGGGDEYQIEKLVIHNNYTTFHHNDIALIRVTKKIEYSDSVSPIALPAVDIDENGFPAVFSGWGSTRLWGESPDELQEIQLNIVSYKTCKISQAKVTSNHICSFSKFGEGICHGDSGGPLVANNSLIGIASYVVPCAIGHPDVYTRVYKYVDWIESVQEIHKK